MKKLYNCFDVKCVFIFLFTLFFSLALLSGCSEERNHQTPEALKTDTSVNSTVDTSMKKSENSIPDLKGTWSGKFDKRQTDLKISEQDSTEFKGKITIRYREVINQEVKGTVDPVTNHIKMKDQLHSRYQGKYSTDLLNSGTQMKGTFTMDLNGKQFSFDLKKK